MAAATKPTPQPSKTVAKKAPAKKAAPAKKPAQAKTVPAAKKAPAKKAPAATKAVAAKPTTPEVGDDLLSMTQVWLRHDEVFPNRENLREMLTDIPDLAASIASVGLLEPLIVTVDGKFSGMITGDDPGYYVIVAGHRRHYAIAALIADGRWPADRRIACVVGPNVSLTTEERTVQMLIENLQRVDLNPVEEANGYKRLVDAGWKQSRIADAVGRHQNRVSERMQLFKLPDVWRTAVATGELTLGLAAQLAALTQAAMGLLIKAGRTPDKHSIETAGRQARIDLAVETTKRNAAERGLHYLNKGAWQMSEFVWHNNTSPAGLAKVLLPAEVVGWAVTVETYREPAKVTIWQPTTAGAVTREQTPHEVWVDDCVRVRSAHAAALVAYKVGADVVEIEWARTVEPKVVAAACMRFELEACGDTLDELAGPFGWQQPLADDDTIAAHLADWYSHAGNLTAVVARLIVNKPGMTPASFQGLRDLYLAAAGLGAPEALVLPLEPDARAAADKDWALDAEADDIDENAHLDDIDNAGVE